MQLDRHHPFQFYPHLNDQQLTVNWPRNDLSQTIFACLLAFIVRITRLLHPLRYRTQLQQIRPLFVLRSQTDHRFKAAKVFFNKIVYLSTTKN